MLHEFLLKNQKEILTLTQRKTLQLAGNRPSSAQLELGLPLFLRQFLGILQLQRPAHYKSSPEAAAKASGEAEETALSKSAGLHGAELLRLGYTLSHVVHAYGAMCQAVTELATEKQFPVSTREFHDLNQCLDVAIAGAVTQFQSIRDTEESRKEVEHLGVLAHEMRNALTSAAISYELIKKGTVGPGGNTGRVLENSLRRIQGLIDRSLTEVRLRVDPKVRLETCHLLQMIDQILVTAEVEAQARNQKIEINVDPGLTFESDEETFYSALSNLIQNALKYTPDGGTIQLRAAVSGGQIGIEVEDECGGLSVSGVDLFQPYVQKNKNRKGLGLGLTIAQRAIELNQGKIEAVNLPGKGCIFRMTLPQKSGQGGKSEAPAA